MKTVQDLCLGVAVAGVVVGAGSVLGCAVAFADSATSESSADTRSDARAATTTDVGPADRASAGAASAAASGSRHRAAARPEAAGAGGDRAADRVDASARAAARVSAPVSHTADTGDGGAYVPGLRSAGTVPAPAAGLLAALQPVTPFPLPAPTPVLPAAPAGALTVTAASTAGRSRSASVTASQIGDPDPTHVLLIGVDGTNLSKILEYAYDEPNSGFRVVMDQSLTGATSIVGHTTISGPSWTTILTGVWDNKSGVINNLFDPAPYIPWPTVFNQLEYFDSSINTAVFANWQYINDIAGAGSYPVAPADNVFVGFSNSWEDTDDLVVDATIARINATQAADSTFVFSYQVAVDEAGHAHGGDSPEYVAAVLNTSENIARIMDAIDAWETANPGQEWTVIVTTDHGHQQSVGFGHGFQSPNETSSFVMFDLEGDGANDGKQNLGYTNADVTPTIVNLFGAPSRSDFDGVPLQTKVTSIVDPIDLKQALNDAIGMYGYPNIGDDIALGVRTVFASIPYFLDGFVNTVTGQLQDIVDADIFLVSALAGVAEFVVQIVGDILVGTTQAIARVVATLTGSGVIPPSDPPLPPPSSAVLLPVPPAAVLV